MGIGMGIFILTLKEWGLTDNEVHRLMGPIGDAPWTDEQIRKADLVNSIYLALKSLPRGRAITWPTKRNPAHPFNGKRPLDLMFTGVEGMEAVLKVLQS